MGCYPEMANISKLKSFQKRFKAFSLECFEEEKSNTITKKHYRVIRVWSEAFLACQEVKQILEEKLLEFDGKQNLQRIPDRDETMLNNDKTSLQFPTSCLTSSSLANVKAQFQPVKVNIHEDSALGSILTAKLVKFSCGRHSEANLKNVDLVGRGERNQALGRSYSEGSCVKSFSPILTGPPISVCPKTYSSQPNMLLADTECVTCHRDSFCSDFSDMKLEWIQMDSRDKPRVTLNDQDSQIFRQESFCSSVSSPRQGWKKEEKSSRIYLNDRNSGYSSRDPVTPDRLRPRDISDCTSASELENSSNLL